MSTTGQVADNLDNETNADSGVLQDLTGMSLNPLQSFSVRYGGAQIGTAVNVQMVSNDGLDVQLSAFPNENGVVDLAVPFDPRVDQREIQLFVDNQSAGVIAVSNAPGSEDLAPLGEVTRLFVLSILDDLNNIDNELSTGPTSSLETSIQLDERILKFGTLLNAIDIFQDRRIAVEVTFGNAQPVLIDEAYLSAMDLFLAHFIIAAGGTDTEGSLISTNTFSKPGSPSLAIQLRRDLSSTPLVQQAIDNVKGSLALAEKGAQVLLGGVGALLTIGGIFISAEVAVVGAVMLGGAAILWEFGNANALLDIATNKSAAIVRRAQNSVNSLVNIALAACGSVNTFCGIIGEGKNAKEFSGGAKDFFCSRDSAQCEQTPNDAGSCPAPRAALPALTQFSESPVNSITLRGCLLPADPDNTNSVLQPVDLDPSDPDDNPDPVNQPVDQTPIDSPVDADPMNTSGSDPVDSPVDSDPMNTTGSDPVDSPVEPDAMNPPVDSTPGDLLAFQISVVQNSDGSFFINPTQAEILTADIQVTGGASTLQISWRIPEATVLTVVASNPDISPDQSLFFGISGEFVEGNSNGQGFTRPLPQPITYGDYSQTGTEPVAFALTPSPVISSGSVYAVQVLNEQGATATITFTVL